MFGFPDLSNTILTFAIACVFYKTLLLALVPLPSNENIKQNLSRSPKGRYLFFDTMRGVAITAVLVIHVTYLFPLEMYPDMPAGVLHACNALLRFALPIFFISSGILLVPPTLQPLAILAFYRRQFVRVAIPYLLSISILQALYSDFSFLHFVQNFFTGEISVPYYFVAVLLQLYILYPFMAHLASQRKFVYVTFAISFVSNLLPSTWEFYEMNTFLPFLFFFVWGIYMRPQIFQGTVRRNYFPWVTFLALFIVGYFLYPGEYYNSLFFYGTTIFMLSYFLATKNPFTGWFSKLFSFVGELSLWVFLIHFPLQKLLLPYIFSAIKSGWLAFLMSSIASFILSIVLAYITSTIYSFLTSKAFFLLKKDG